MEESPHIRELTTLNQRIDELEPRRASLSEQYRAARRARATARLRHAYQQLQLAMRRPTASFELWPLGVMLVAPLLPGLLGLAIGLMFSTAVGVLGFLVGILLGGVGAWRVMFVPGSVETQGAEVELREARLAASQLQLELTSVERQLHADRQARAVVQESIHRDRERLLQQKWQAMRDPEWEAFALEAFTLLGGRVQRMPPTADGAISFIAELGDRRWAVLAKGLASGVGHDAVQQAVDGMARQRCNRSAVVTNSGFTAAAIALAKRKGCRLIADHQIADLILGKLEL